MPLMAKVMDLLVFRLMSMLEKPVGSNTLHYQM